MIANIKTAVYICQSLNIQLAYQYQKYEFSYQKPL